MRNLKWGIMAVSIAAAGLVLGCGGNGSSDTCTTDADCDTGFVCHTLAKACVKSCNGNSDCPTASPTCGTLAGVVAPDGGVSSFCQCTSTSCGNEGECSDSYKVCLAKKCTTNANCPTGQTCNNGECVAGGAGSCTYGSCASGKICNFDNGECETAAACSSTNVQPDTCHYGQYCQGSACDEVPSAPTSCSGFGTGGANWTAGKTGPVIYSVVSERRTPNSSDTFCDGTATRFRVMVKAYSKIDNTFPASNNATFDRFAPEIALEGMLHFIRPDGTEIPKTNPIVQHLVTTNNGKNAEFAVNYCPGGADVATYQAALFFENGNEYCSVVP